MPLIVGNEVVGYIEALDAVPALGTEWDQRIERHPRHVPVGAETIKDLVEPTALPVVEEDRGVRVDDHRRDAVRHGIEYVRQRLDGVGAQYRRGAWVGQWYRLVEPPQRVGIRWQARACPA